MTIQILDIYYANKFDAVQEKAAGTAGVIIKGGQGQYPEYFAKKSTYIDDCKQAGMPWGIYWLVDARFSPESQKAALKAAFPTLADFGPLGLWLDCEKPDITMTDFNYSKLPYAYYKTVESVWRGVEAYTGKYPGIYTSIGAWKLIFGGASDALAQEFAAKCPLWTAQYGTNAPQTYGAWKTYFMWQYKEGPDYSVFNGTQEQFDAWAGQGSGTVVQPAASVTHVTVKLSDNTTQDFDNVQKVSITTQTGTTNFG